MNEYYSSISPLKYNVYKWVVTKTGVIHRMQHGLMKYLIESLVLRDKHGVLGEPFKFVTISCYCISHAPQGSQAIQRKKNAK